MPNGSIAIARLVQINGTHSVTKAKLNITSNRAFLNSTNLTFFNQTAIITLNGITSADPLPLVDLEDDGTFAPCTSTADPFCTEISFSGGVLVFNVSHFTTFSSTEGGVNITLTKADNPDPVSAGGFLNYTVTVNVTSDSPANVTLTDIYPNEIIFLSAQPTPITGTNNTFVLGNLTNGTAVVVNVSVLVLNISSSAVINNTANISFQNATGATIMLNVTENTTVTVAANDTPSIAQVILNNTQPISNHTLENLTFFVINATGPNDNPVQNISDWRRWNGTEFESIAVLNFPFESNVSSVAAGAIRNYVSRSANATLGDGSASSAPAWIPSGQVGGAYVFDGANDAIRQTSSSPYGFNETEEVTAMAWIRLASTSTFDFWLSMHNELGSTVYRFGSDTSGNPYWNMGSGVDQVFTGFVFNTSVWYHVAFVGQKNGSSIGTSVYVNGTLIHTGMVSGTTFAGANSSLIGTGESIGTHPFDGTIDDVVVLPRALGSEQVRLAFEAGLQGGRPSTLVHDETHAREIWQVAVTPNNGANDGITALSNNLTVLSDPPSNVQVFLNTTNPATNDTNQNLTALITNATDPANNSVYNITDWRVNGTSLAIMNFPFDTDESRIAANAVRDYSTFGRNATLGNGVLSQSPEPAPGKIGFGYRFDGGNDGIRQTSSVPYGFNETVEITMMGWINMSAVDLFDIWLTLQNELGGITYRLGSDSSRNPFWTLTGADQTFTGVTFALGQWYHVALVGRINESDGIVYAHLYVNGTRVHTALVGGTSLTGVNSTLIGTGESFGTNAFVGIVDEVQVYNRALSDEQILQVYNEGEAGRHWTTVVSNETGAGDVWGVCVTPNDIDQDGNTTCSNNVTISGGPAPGITSCPVTINVSTTLTQGIASNDTCVTIGGDNLTLDCAGFSILYNANGTDNEYGILAVGRINITIKDCIIRDINDTAAAGVGINITNTNMTTIRNTTIFTNGTTNTHGIAFNIINTSTVANNTIIPNGTSQNHGIFLQSTDAVDIRDNNISILVGSSQDGISSGLLSVNNTIAFNRIIISLGSVGIRLSTNTRSSVIFNNISLTGGGATKTGINVGAGEFNNITSNNVSVAGIGSPLAGIELASSTNNNIVNDNIIFVNSTIGPIYGLRTRFANSNNNNFTGNAFRIEAPAVEAYGITVEDTSINNRFNRTNITVVSTSGYGILIVNSNHTIFDTTLLSPAGWLNISPGIFSNFTNTTFLQPNGSIRIASLVQADGPQDVTKAKLNITFNRAFLNSSNLTFLNTTGIITLNGITSADPLPLVDFEDDGTFVPCLPTANPFCTELSFSGGVFVFNTSHFTSFSSTEGGVNITLTKTDSPDPVSPVSLLNYTIVINVTSDSPANVTLTDTYPSEVVFNSSQPDPATGTNNTFILGNLTNGSVVVVNITVLVLNVSNGTVINNTANVSFQNATGATIMLNVTENTTIEQAITPAFTPCPVTINASTTLTNNLRGSGTCVTIGNNSVTLNCNNFSILYDANGVGGDGIVITSRTNVIIENCTIRDINASGAAGIGINVTGSTVRLRNNNILTNGSRDNHGITLFTSTTTSLIANNTIRTQGTQHNNTGILVSFSTLLNITDNTVFTNGTFNNFGIRTDDFSENNRITNNSVFTDGNASFNIGIYIDLSDNTRVERNRITTNGTFSNYGILLNDFTDFATVANNTINSGGNNSGNIGVFIAFVSGSNNVSDNTIRTNGTFSNYGIVVQEFAAFNRIENNSISTGGSGTANYGIFLVNLSTNTTILKNLIRTSGSDSGEGVLIRHFSHENNVTNNTILTNSLGGFNIGIHLDSLADRNIISGNIIITNGTSSNNGINALNETNDNRIENNSITTDGSSSFNWGIWTNFSGGTVINRNFIRANGRSDGSASSVNGITLQSSTVGSTIENNTIIVSTNGSNNFGIDDAVFEANISNNIVTVSGSRESHGIRKIFSERSVNQNNTITVSGADSDALQVTDANTNSFINNTIVSHTRYAAHVTRSLRNIFSQSLLPAAVGSLYVNESNGSITWYPSVNITSATNLSQVINVSFNHIRLNSTDANGGQLNHSAELEFRALTFLEPEPIRDFEDDGTFLHCAPPACREKNYTNGIYTYNVTAFTTYAAGETGGSLIVLDKSDSPDPVNASSTLTYTINVTSQGNATAFNVTVNDTYPAQVIFQSSQPGAVGGTNNTFILGNLTNGTSILVNITVLVLNVSNGTIINNTANVTFQNATGAVVSAAETESTTVENVTVAPPAPAPAAGGGGGGGWTTPTPRSVFPEQEQPTAGACLESWACEGWSQCAGGRQVRKCIDLGRCNTTRFLPMTERACEMPAQELPASEPFDAQPPELEFVPPALPAGLPWKWITTVLIILLCIAVLTATFRAGYQPGTAQQRMPPMQEMRLPPASQRVPRSKKGFYAKLDELDRELDDVDHGKLPKMPQNKPVPAPKQPKPAKVKPVKDAPAPKQQVLPTAESKASPQLQGLFGRIFRIRERETAIEQEDARLRRLDEERRFKEAQREEERAASQLAKQQERELAKEVALQQKLARGLERERLRDEQKRVRDEAKRVREERAQALKQQKQERERLIEERKRLRIEESRARKEPRLQQPVPEPVQPMPLPVPKPAGVNSARPKIGKEAKEFYRGLSKYDDDLDRLEAQLQKKLKKR
jgi:hypothetical protein